MSYIIFTDNNFNYLEDANYNQKNSLLSLTILGDHELVTTPLPSQYCVYPSLKGGEWTQQG